MLTMNMIKNYFLQPQKSCICVFCRLECFKSGKLHKNKKIVEKNWALNFPRIWKPQKIIKK